MSSFDDRLVLITVAKTNWMRVPDEKAKIKVV